VISQLEGRKIELEALCRRFRVSRLEIFGSAATGGFRSETSDIDFVVEFEQPCGPGCADRYFGLMEALEELFGRRVDLVVATAIRNPYFREMVETTKVLLYAA
jgi:hypothetical protein